MGVREFCRLVTFGLREGTSQANVFQQAYVLYLVFLHVFSVGNVLLPDYGPPRDSVVQIYAAIR